MSMTKADILYDCIGEELDETTMDQDRYAQVYGWLSELHDLADPQAIELRIMEIELEELRSELKNYC